MPSTSEIRRAFDSIDGTDVHYVSSLQRATVTVPEEGIGQAFGILRRNDFDFKAKRLGDSLVAHIETDRRSLGDLF